MASGVGVRKECEEVYASLQKKSTTKGNDDKPRFITFKMSDDNKEIVVDHIEPQGTQSTYADFVNNLKSAKTKDGNIDCRYAVIDYEYKEESGALNSKIVFIAWNPDTASIKQKMLYTSSKDALKKKFDGVHKEMQCNDDDDISEKEIIAKIKTGDRK